MRDLAITYRPKDWESIVGQDVLVKTLKNELTNDSIGQSYLFCGTRGTGKTTTARVFANNLNAQIIELDGASNNGVEHIRNLKEDVIYLPSNGCKRKVYIIDEFHMVTTNGQNAFLKVLEEPPAHVVFILATTDPQKILPTIISRVQRFDLRRISNQDIVNRLAYIAEQENIQTEYDALEYIARSVDGGLRDAIKLLQKCSSLDDIVIVQTVVDALGSVDIKHLQAITTFLLDCKVPEVLTYFNDLVSQGIDIKVFLADIIQYLTDTMANSLVSDRNKDISNFMELAEEFLSLLQSLRNATQLKTLTELKLIRMCRKIDPIIVQPQSAIINVEAHLDEIKVDDGILERIMSKLGGMETRMLANELQIDTLKFRR